MLDRKEYAAICSEASEIKRKDVMNIGPMLNLYPDSLGGTLDDVVDFLKTEEAEGAFFFLLYSAQSVPYGSGQRFFRD